MFSFFKKSPRLPASEDEMKLIEESFQILEYTFGSDFQKKRGFVYPVKEQFPYDNLQDTAQLDALAAQLADMFFVGSDRVTILKYSTLTHHDYVGFTDSRTEVPTVNYTSRETVGKVICDIVINQEMLRNPMKAVYLIAWALASFQIDLHELYFEGKKEKYLRDIAVIYFGFGIFIDDVRLVKEAMYTSAVGVLPVGMIAGANALYSFQFGCNEKNVKTFFQSNSKELYLRCLAYYRKNGTLLSKTEDEKPVTAKAERAPALRTAAPDYKIREEDAKQHYRLNPQMKTLINNIGYWQLCQGDYKNAIKTFDELLGFLPDHAFGLNNRGYCKLMLGQLEEGLADVNRSIEFAPDNSFSWRNLGVYHLKQGDGNSALENFQMALQLDEKTELIQFYLGKAYLLLNETEMAKKYFERSRGIPEFPLQEYPVI